MNVDFGSLVTGTLNFREIEFVFTYNREELRLIPAKKDIDQVDMWFKEEIGNGIFTLGEPLHVEEDYLIGQSNEGREIVFLLNKGTCIGRINSVLILDVYAYVWKRISGYKITQIEFLGPEIDYIYSAYNAVGAREKNEDGELVLKIKSFADTTSERKVISVDGRDVIISFGIIKREENKESISLMDLKSTMYFEFDETDDYLFIIKLYAIAKTFIQFLCYRKNVTFKEVILSGPIQEIKKLSYGMLHVIGDSSETEMKCLKDGRFIRYDYIKGYEVEILNDIAKGKLYIRNIPNSYRDGKSITAARFIMITAAFEWEFRRLYPDGIEKKTRTLNAEDDVRNEIEMLHKDATGKKKEIYKNVLKGIGFTTLASKIRHTGKNLNDIIEPFGKRLYRLNKAEFNYSKMGERLAKQRNDYAHGNLVDDFEILAIVDLIFLEVIIYAMQLKYYKISDINIKKAINELFNQNFLIKD